VDDELNLDPDAIPTDPPADTPPADPAAAPEPAKPTFLLEVDERTRYDDPAKAKQGFVDLKGDRDRHKTRSEQLEEENRRLKLAVTGGAPDDGKPKSQLTPEAKQKQIAWLQSVKPDLGILTLEDLERPEVQAALEKIIEKREQNALVQRGHAHVAQALKGHGIELSPVRQRAFLDYLGGVIRDEESAEIRTRFLAGDMTVLDELIEEHFAAHIAARSATHEADEAKQKADRDRRGRYAKVEDVKGKLRTNVPAGPPKGGGAAVSNAPQEVPKTPEERRKKMNEVLTQMAG